MLAEDQFAIVEFEAWIVRDGKGMTIHKSVYGDDPSSTLDKRYKILNANGTGQFQPADFYTSPCSDECVHAGAFMERTRKYKRDLDRTYFKFYDDADEVKQNMIRFILWLKNQFRE